MKEHPDLAHGGDIIPYAIVDNVWQAIEDLFMQSAASRALVEEEKVKVVGAIYDVGTGKVSWLPEEPVEEISGQRRGQSRTLDEPAGRGDGNQTSRAHPVTG